MRASACASPGKAEGGTGSPPPEKKKQGGRGGGERTAHSHQTTRQHHKRRPNPPPRRHRRQDPQRGTGGPLSQNGQHQARNSGPTGKGTPKNADRHHAGQKKTKRDSSPARKKGNGGTGTTRPRTGTASNRHHKAQPKHAKKNETNTPRQPIQEGRGTAETRAQHAGPYTAPQPGMAGNKRGARTNMHPRTATPARRCRGPRRTGARAHTRPNTPPRRGGAQPKPKPQHTRPHRTPEPETAGGKQSAHTTTHV